MFMLISAHAYRADLPARPIRLEPEAPTPEQTSLLAAAVAHEVRCELERAMALHPTPLNSAHEGYAVALEEVDELWEHVKTNQRARDLSGMRKEAIQAAAMFMRFVVEVCDGGRGRV